jgi:hypothetical protein
MRDTMGSSKSSCDDISPLGTPSSTVVSTLVRALSFSESESVQLSWVDIRRSKEMRELVNTGEVDGR